jgi:hypothetical protein
MGVDAEIEWAGGLPGAKEGYLVVGLVYIYALAPDVDGASQSRQQKFPVTDVFGHIEVVDGRIWLKPSGIACFAGDLPENEQKRRNTHALRLADSRLEIGGVHSNDTIVAQTFLACPRPKPETGRMKALPQNVMAFRIGGWAVHNLDQKMLKRLKKIADREGWTIEEAMTDAVREFVAECELEE